MPQKIVRASEERVFDRIHHGLVFDRMHFAFVFDRMHSMFIRCTLKLRQILEH